MNKIFLICTFILIGLNHSIANEISKKRYKLSTTILFTNGVELETTIDAIYPTFEEVNCTDETIIVSIVIDSQGKITKPENLISGTDYFIDEIQDALENFIVPKQYYDLDGIMSIRFSILKESISKTIYTSAFEKFKSKNYIESFTQLSEIKGNDKNNICVLMLMGNALTKQGKYSQAIPYYDQALKISPQNDRIHYSRGYRRYKSGLLDKAIEDIQMSIKLRDVWENYYLLNAIYNEKEDYLNAIKYATLGFEFRKGSYFHNRRGWSYISNENYRLAILDFEEIIKLEPENELGYTGKSRALRYLKKYDEASSFIDKSIELNGEDKYLLFDKAMIFDSQLKLNDASEIYKRIIENYNAGSGTYNNLGWVLLRLKKYNDAIDLFNFAIQNNLTSNNIRANLATAYFLNNQFDLSNQLFNKEIGIDIDNNNVFEHAGVARNHIKLKNLKNALTSLEYVVGREIDYYDAYYEHKYGAGNHLAIIIEEFIDYAKEVDDKDMLISIQEILTKVNNHE